ncbi:MAG: NAD(P)/FAD-dependent oxidoreductase, partial [Solirubrobacterales bacterium]|nr:NAD(P)/FAD-dependent oxidoreductase [Solirubrobacterales bacterium]
RQVRDPQLRERLTPSYVIGCKRILVANDYYPALTRPNVELVTDRIERITRRGIVTIDGRERELDAIVFATGFQVAEWPSLSFVRGRDGATLSDVWRERGAQAFLGTTVSRFPNFFILLGPGTGLGHNSVVYMIESQIGYVVDCLRMMSARRISTVEVRPKAQDVYDANIQSRLANTVWASGCASWYLHPSGRNPALWPSFTFRYRRQMGRFDPGLYRLRACSSGAAGFVPDRGGLDVVV